MMKKLLICTTVNLLTWLPAAYAATTLTTPATVDATACYQATEGCLLLVKPSDWSDTKRRHYGLLPVCAGNGVDLSNLYYHDLTQQEQVNRRVFLGRTFCGGKLSISDMHLPFVKDHEPLHVMNDANDGMLLLKVLQTNLEDVNTLLTRLQVMATAASRQVASEEESAAFDSLLNEINRVANTANMDGISILANARKKIMVSIHHQKDHVAVPLVNATTGHSGLDIDMLDIRTMLSAGKAIQALSNAIDSITTEMVKLQKVKPVLEEAINTDETVYTVEMSGPQFVFQHFHPA